MSRRHAKFAVAALLLPAAISAQTPKVGPPRGTVIVVGGGSMGPEIYSEFIKAAGGPDALIIDVPNAGGAESYGQDAAGTRGFKTAGARNVHVLHTRDRKIADSDSFVAVIKKAGGARSSSSPFSASASLPSRSPSISAGSSSTGSAPPWWCSASSFFCSSSRGWC